MVLVDGDRDPGAGAPAVVYVQPVYRAGRATNKTREEAIVAAQIADRDAERRRRDPERKRPESHLEAVQCRIDSSVFRDILDPQCPHRDVANVVRYANRMCVAATEAARRGLPHQSTRPWPVAYVTAASFNAYVVNTGCHITDVITVGSTGIVVEVAFCASGHLVGGVLISLADMKRDNDKMMRASRATGEDLERTLITQFARLRVMMKPAHGSRPIDIRAKDPRSFALETTCPLLVLSCAIELIDENTKTDKKAGGGF